MRSARLFTTYYKEPDKGRRGELDVSLAVNAMFFDSVHVLAESCNPRMPDGAECRILTRRQTYDDAITWANEVAGADDLIVIANCDIIVPYKSVEIMFEHVAREDAYCLSRYEIEPGGGLKPYLHDFSQDVWAFRGPIRPVKADWAFGVPGCENKFALQLLEAGYRVTNPSKSIKTYHVHASGSRTKTNHKTHRLPPPYLWVYPTALGQQLEEHHHVVNK